MDSGLAPTARPGMTAELANAPLPCCFARRGHRRSLFSFPPMRGMERREAPGAIDGRPFGGPLSGARLHAVDGGVRPPGQSGLRLTALHRGLIVGDRSALALR